MTLISGIMMAVPAMAQQEQTAGQPGTNDRILAIDVHSHNVLPEFKAVLKEHDALMDENFPLPEWNAEDHLKFMEQAGISTSVLSMPAPQPYFGDSEECIQTIREYNEACARLKARYPGKFLFCASLPLPDVDAAVKEAVYALDTLGADGIKLATNSRGQYLGDKELDPLMQILSEHNAVVILHPHKPVPVNEGLLATTPLAAYEYPAETTRALANMIMRNVPARYPGIKFVIPHCGSFLPLALPRMKGIHKAMLAKGMAQEVDWDANLRNFYYDLAGSPEPEVISALLDITAPDHLLYGSDYPYQPSDVLASNLERLRTYLTGNKLLAPYTEDILYRNAAKLFLGDKEVQTADGSTDRTGKGTLNMCAKLPMQPDGIVRLSKIEVYPEYLDEYLKFATEVGQTSLLTEPGVLTMYALQEIDNPCSITILETYASQEAYKKHIASAHFQKYKQGTLHMVKTLVLSDQTPLNPVNKVWNYIDL